MATMGSDGHYGDAAVGDPFISNTHHRYSNFDNQLFALGPTTSPEQAKRALEAHLAETERRIQDASKLGTTLVEQRKELASRLKEVEKQQDGGDITPELRQKLVEIETEYNEVGRESARAFLPKSRVTSEMGGPTYPIEPKRSVSPSKFESQATASPSKLSVPNRKLRNQPSNRVHDIEFATEISTSLLGQVRQLQALLSEKEDSLKVVSLDKAKLEAEAEGFNKRLRALDESEHRYKDENWNLETQIHDHIATAKEAADREKKLTQALNLLQAQKTTAQEKLDEMKLTHARLTDTYTAAVKHHDMEIGGHKRNMNMVENERWALQRKVEDLTGQNQELAMGIARQRAMADEQENHGPTDDDFETADDNITPEHSPPPSPIKNTPRHSHLETETIKSSLHHAHRMIQSLKGNIHREKTEKVELKRMLQDARDELEVRRADVVVGTTGKRTRKVDSREVKKPFKAGQLGGLRASKSEISIEEAQWEDQDAESSPTRSVAERMASMPGGYVQSSDQFETGNETSDAFETANERGTESDFHTGNEGFSDSDETETEGANVGTIRGRRQVPLGLTTPGNRDSYQSTASLSGDEYSYSDIKTPVQNQNQPQRLRLRKGRGSDRRSRIDSDQASLEFSPNNTSNNGTPQQPGQSLFAELGELDSDDDSFAEGTVAGGTPTLRSITSEAGTPASVLLPPFEERAAPAVPRPAMVDSGVMTDAWEPAPAAPHSGLPSIAGAGLVGAGLVEAAHQLGGRRDSVSKHPMSDASSQWHDEQPEHLIRASPWLSDNRPISMVSDASTQPGDIEERLARFPAPPTFTMSSILAQYVEPIIPEERPVTPVPMAFSSIDSMATEPLSPVQRPVTPVKLAFTSIDSTATEPISPVEKVVTPIKMAFSSIGSAATEPLSPVLRPVTPVKLAFTPIETSATEPISPVQRPVTPVNMVISSIGSTATEPISPVEKVVTPIKMGFSSIGSTMTEPLSPVERPVTPLKLAFTPIGSMSTEPISPVEKAVIPVQMGFSSIGSTMTEPLSPVKRAVTPPKLAFTPIGSTSTEPISPMVRSIAPAKMAFSSIGSTTTEPVVHVEKNVPPILMAFSSIGSTATEPLSPVERPVTPLKLAFVPIESTATEPISPVEKIVTPPKLAFVPIASTATEPISPVEKAVTPLKLAFVPFASTATEPVSPVQRPITPVNMAFSSIGSTATEPISPVDKVVTPVKMAFSSIGSTTTEPLLPVQRPATPVELSFSSVGFTATEPVSPFIRPVTPKRPITPIAFVFSSINSLATEPIEAPVPVIARGFSPEIKEENPDSPKDYFGGVANWTNDKTPTKPVIAEDETRQSPSQTPAAQTPESQRPFKELSVNTNGRPAKKPKLETMDSTAQTSLTAGEIDSMFQSKAERQNTIFAEDSETLATPARAPIVPFALRVRRSQESFGNVRNARPSSSASTRRSSSFNSHPPLPSNHQQAIAAASQRVGSSSSSQGGLMGPPILPLSAYRSPNAQFRPTTSSSSQGPVSPQNSTTARSKFLGGNADVLAPNSNLSRASSVTSFASEIEGRFNLRNAPPDLPGLGGSGTDPRMIQAITQTMIGEYLWKYTRKAGRKEMSDTRHRRYFWVHPYTRTLYWSDRDPSTAGRLELKAKSVAIEAVRVVTDDNPMPPGLHRKSLIVLTPGRAVKFTAQTGQRHETWFNALSYLLLRTEDARDAEDVVGALTGDDTDFDARSRSASRVRPSPGAASLSSYHSHTTRVESPVMMERPTLAANLASSRGSMGRLSRLSSYWKAGGAGEARGRPSVAQAGGRESIYQASVVHDGVHDSAEDVREMIERQDRESDRLENVRACCDGKHDVGHLSHTPNSARRSRMSQAGSRSNTPVPGGRPGATSRQSRQSIPE